MGEGHDERELEIEVPEMAPPVDIGPLEAFAYAWLLENEAQSLAPIAHTIASGLEKYIASLYWNPRIIHVDEDFIYVLLDAPDESTPHDVIEDLMRHAAEIASQSDSRLESPHLWSDSYLVVVPGRELTLEEIQQFVRFVRDN